MNINTTSLLRPSARLVTTVRDELRDRREARVARRTLERELSSYRTQAEVNDLLGSLKVHDDAQLDEIRAIIARNQLRHSLHRAS